MRITPWGRSGLLASALCALALGAAPGRTALAADQVLFTFEGTVQQSSLGYTAGQAVSFSFLLDNPVQRDVRESPDPAYPQSSCCGGAWGWYQDSNAQDHLWADVYGTGLSGSWDPVVEASQPLVNSSLVLSLRNFPQPPSNTINLQANDFAGTNTNTGLLANGFRVTGFQFNAVFSLLDPLGVYGLGLYGQPVSDPTALFLGLTGTYSRDATFSQTARLQALTPQGISAVDLSLSSLTVSAVPAPAAAWLLLAGLPLVAARARRQRHLPAPAALSSLSS